MQPTHSPLELPSLEQVLDRLPVTVTPETVAIAAIALMNHERSRYLLVVQETQLLGILTERDVVRLVSEGINFSKVTVGEVMTSQVVTLHQSQAQDISEILLLLNQHRIHQLPIVNDREELVGIVTDEGLHRFLQPANFLSQLQAETTLQLQIAQERLIADTAQRIRRSLNLNEILQSTVDRVRQFLRTDRVVIFRFAPDWSGRVVVESVDSNRNSILSTRIHDPCFRETYIEPYRQGRTTANTDIYAAGLEQCHIDLLSQFQVRANLVVPIVQQSYAVSSSDEQPAATSHLWGLLIAHHCVAPRQWQPLEITLLQQLATQVAIAIQQSELYQQAQSELIERRRAEEALRENNERLTLALEAAKMGSWDWDIVTNEVIWNSYHETIFGYEPGMPIRTYQHWRDRVHPEDLPKVEAALQAACDQQQDYECEYRVVHPNKSVHWVVTYGRFYYNEAGQPIRVVGMLRDITDKKQLETQFLRTQRLDSLGTLSSGIAHDLNNVLTPILAAAQYLQLRISQTDERSQQMLKLLETNAQRGADLVKQVLSFARGVDGRRVPLQVGHLLNEIEQIIKRTFPKAIELRTHIPTSTLWTVTADATQLHQVIMNLCVNARDAMSNGVLTISAENQFVDETFARMHLNAHVGPHIVITIADTGVGIPSEILDQIFDPFFTTKEVGKGTGLGLSTAIGIIKSHHGFINVTSEVGQGTQFKVYLPAVEDKIEALSSHSMPSAGQGELVLIVDDEVSVQEITKTVLEDHNYRTIVANDGFEAIARYAEHQQEISVVLMDIMMPSMGGLTAIRTLQKLNSQVKIVATSGLATTDQIAEITHAGINTFLTKPYTAPDLLNAIQEATH